MFSSSTARTLATALLLAFCCPAAVLASGGDGESDWILDVGGAVVWRPIRTWDLALGYNDFSRKIETETFYNKVNYNIPYLSISRFW